MDMGRALVLSGDCDIFYPPEYLAVIRVPHYSVTVTPGFAVILDPGTFYEVQSVSQGPSSFMESPCRLATWRYSGGLQAQLLNVQAAMTALMLNREQLNSYNYTQASHEHVVNKSIMIEESLALMKLPHANMLGSSLSDSVYGDYTSNRRNVMDEAAAALEELVKVKMTELQHYCEDRDHDFGASENEAVISWNRFWSLVSEHDEGT